MYKNYEKFENIGPAFEELSEEEMMWADGAATPFFATVSVATKAATAAVTKAALSALVTAASGCTIIVIFD